MTAKITIYKSLLTDEVLIEKSTSKKTLSKALFYIKELQGEPVIVYVNDVFISPNDWHIYKLKAFDDIRVIPDPNKGALPWIGAAVMVGLFIAFPALLAGGWSFTAFLKAAMIGYAIGSVADGLLFPPEMPQLPGMPDTAGADPSYGWDGARLVTQPDGPVSILYGQHIISGTLIMQYNSSDGDKNYLHMLVALGEGEISGIMKSDESGVCTSNSDTPSLEINGQPYTNYTGCTWDYRLGTYNQTVIDGFHNTSTYYADGRKISKGTPVTYTSTGIDIEEFEVQLTCPTLFAQDDKGNINENSVTYKLEYQVVGAGSWTDGGTHMITNKSKTVTYEYKKISNLTAGQYNIRITRDTPEYTSFKKGGALYITGITETTYENIAYRNSVLLALKIQATDQLSGSIPNVTVLVRGKKILVPELQVASVTQTYDDCYWHDGDSTYKLISGDWVCTDTGNYVRQWSRHPIWGSKDFITNSRYGLGEYIENADFDNANAVIEARYCWEMVDNFNGGTEHRFEMDLPISRFMAAPSAIKLLSRCFRGNIIWSNGTYKPIIDRARTPVQLFNESNIDPSSLKTTYLKASQIPNFVEVQYADPERNYNLNAVEIVDEDEWTSIKPLRRETINARGTVRASECLRSGRYYLNCGQYVTKIHEFDSDLDAVHCESGDVVQVQNDLLAWGVGGRIVAATSSSITTNINITYTAAYKIRVRLSDGTLETKTVTSVSNNFRTINISGSFTSTPLVDSVFSYGATDVDSKPFKVKTMTLKDHNKCSLVLAEESANKYTDTTGVSLPDPIYTTLPNPAAQPGNVTDLDLSEMSNKPGFYVSFNIPQNDLVFSYADVHLSLDNSNWWPYRTGVNENSNIEVLGTKPGQVYYVKVIAYNRLGFANLSPVTDNITITDVNFIPPDINGLRLDGEATLNATEFTKKDAKFVWRKGSLTSGAGHLPAGQEPLGAGEWYDDVYYKYWVEIHVGGVRVRKEIIADNSYVYTYEKNIADNTTASNSFTFKVWGFNEPANKKSKNPNTLAVTNPAPAIPANVTAVGYIGGARFYWDNHTTDIDFDYWSYRVKISAGGTWSAWKSIDNCRFSYELNATEKDSYGINAAIYFEVKSYDTFGNASSAVAVNTNALAIDMVDLDTTAPGTPTGLELKSRVDEDADGHQQVVLTASWDISPATDLSRYGWAMRASLEGLYNYGVADQNRAEFQSIRGNTEYFVKVRAEDRVGNKSNYSSVVSLTSSKDTTAPSQPANLSANPGIQYSLLEWDWGSEPDLSYYEIYRNTSNSILATPIAKAKKNYMVDGNRLASTYYYWVKPVDSSGNEGTVSVVASCLPRNVETADVEQIAANKILIDGIVYLSNWRKTDDVTKIDGGEISTRSLNASSIAANVITSSELTTGIIISASANITNLTVPNAKIVDLHGEKISAHTLTATQIKTNTLTASLIASNTIVSGNIAANTITADEMAANSINASQISADAITAPKIKANIITATHMAANTITADEMAANSINASQISANAVTSAKINANAVTSAKINANAVTSAKINANAVTADKINVTNLAAIKADLGAITAGTITLPNTGWIKGGQTGYATGTGFFLGYSGATYKFSLGGATKSLKWDGTDLMLTGKVLDSSNWKDYAAGNFLVIAADTERYFNYESGWTKVKEILLEKAGTLRIKFSAKDDYASGNERAKIYRNGVAVGTLRILTSSYQEWSQDISGWSSNDYVQLYIYSVVYAETYVKNFRLYASDSTAPAVILD